MASEMERDLLASAILGAVGRQAAQLPPAPVTGFLAVEGSRYDHRLMVVGRAPNGWTTPILPEALSTDEAVQRYSHVVLASVSQSDGCPMQWVRDRWGNSKEDYNTARSAFWRGVRGVVDGLGVCDASQEPWPSHIVWSNLYKVAPASGGNPTSSLCSVQLPGCIELFKRELMIYTPARLLLATGTTWASPFLAGASQHGEKNSFVEDTGTLTIGNGNAPIQYVVAGHPQGKPRDQWIEGVVTAFRSLEHLAS